MALGQAYDCTSVYEMTQKDKINYMNIQNIKYQNNAQQNRVHISGDNVVIDSCVGVKFKDNLSGQMLYI